MPRALGPLLVLPAPVGACVIGPEAAGCETESLLPCEDPGPSASSLCPCAAHVGWAELSAWLSSCPTSLRLTGEDVLMWVLD